MDTNDTTPAGSQEITDPIAVLRAAITLDNSAPPPLPLALPEEPRWELGRKGRRRLGRLAAGGLGLLLLLLIGGALRGAAVDALAQESWPAAANPVNTPLPTPTLLPDPTEPGVVLMALPQETPLPSPTPLPALPTPDFIAPTAPPP